MKANSDYTRTQEAPAVATASKIKSYVRQLVQAYNGGNWLDESFTDKLNGLTEREAFASPLAGVHCVAEIVAHCTYWRWVNLHRFQGDNNFREDTIDQLNWIPADALRKTGWSAIKHDLEQTQLLLLRLLEDKTDDFLALEYAPGLSFDYLLEGTLQHDNYHLGQIGLVMRMGRNAGV